MMLSLKTVALAALATAAVAAPIKRDATSDQVAACFNGLVLAGTWPDSCQDAVAAGSGIIQSIALNQLTMDFTGSNAWAPVISSDNVVATLLTIPGVSLPIQSVRQHVVLADGAKNLGNIEAAWAPASVSGSTLTTSLPSSPLDVYADAHSEFSTFVGALASQPSHTVTLKGTVDAQLDLGSYGQKTINGIAFNTDVAIDGLNNLDITFKFMINTNLNVNGVELGSIFSIVNPSKLTLKLGDVSFDTSTASGHVGFSTIKDLTLVPGENIVIASTNVDASAAAAGELLQKLFDGQDQSLQLTGHAQSSANPALNGGLAAANSKVVIPGYFNGAMSQPPHKDWSLKVLPSTGSDRKVEIKATFQSPYYGLPFKYVATSDFYPSYASSGYTLFDFDDSLHFEVSGSGSTTVTFTATLAWPFSTEFKPRYESWVNAANANGHLPLEFFWSASVIVDNDGVTRESDWGTALPANIAVGSDFASILGFFP